MFMLRIVAVLLIAWEPARFAIEALTVVPTIAYRGAAAALELAIHGCVAALAAAAGLALWNAAPDGRKLATIAVAASLLRTIQSLYWSSLPNDTPPGDEQIYAGLACAWAAGAMIVIRRATERPT